MINLDYDEALISNASTETIDNIYDDFVDMIKDVCIDIENINDFSNSIVHLLGTRVDEETNEVYVSLPDYEPIYYFMSMNYFFRNFLDDVSEYYEHDDRETKKIVQQGIYSKLCKSYSHDIGSVEYYIIASSKWALSKPTELINIEESIAPEYA